VVAHDRLPAALIPLFGSNAVVWTTDIAQLPASPPMELLAWMAPARGARPGHHPDPSADLALNT
jgi:hypothetical protein